MKVLKNREIYSLVTKKTCSNPTGAVINITPFILTSVNSESYTLRAGQDVIIYNQGEKSQTMLGAEGLWLQPRTLCCIKTADYIEFKKLKYLISGIDVIHSIPPKKGKMDNFTVWLEPTQPRFISYGSPIAEIRFIQDDLRHIGISEDVEKLFNSIDKKTGFRLTPETSYNFDKRDRFGRTR